MCRMIGSVHTLAQHFLTLHIDPSAYRPKRCPLLRLSLLAGLFHLLSLAKIGAGEQQSPAHRGTNRLV
uniref:Uncharacterized protein n=1 Tax=Candidatus Kentrum sp. DK TaxID=2126562 RepID=A0A450TQ90_9GAMM|nr:MAG: hypothetical protein BECKDK2373B_GA0170837_12661 [Candidatus Kentron sp. DK]